MKRATRDLIEARARRDAARVAFDEQYRRLRGDADAETIGQHLLGRLGKDARIGLDEALDVAAESKGIIAGTMATLALWFLRGPIIAYLDDQWHRHFEGNRPSEANDGKPDDGKLEHR